MHKKTFAFLLSFGMMLGAMTGAVPAYADETTDGFVLGNSAPALLAGGEIASSEGITYVSAEDGITCYTVDEDDAAAVLTEDRGSSLNVFDGELWYTCDNAVYRMDLAERVVETVFEWESEIQELVVVNGQDAYFLSDGNIYMLGEDGVAVLLWEDGEINGFIPTEYGLLAQKGELFDRSIYADGMYVSSGVYSWNVTEGKLVLSCDGAEYEQGLDDVFSDSETAEGFVLYDGGSVDVEDIFSHGDCEECDHVGEGITQDTLIEQQEAAMAAEMAEDEEAAMAAEMSEDGEEAAMADEAFEDDEAVAISAFASVSSGQKNMVRRAKQQLNIKWTPLKDIAGWAREVVFEKGKTYRGIPYGQAIYARYIPYKEDNVTISTAALELFLKMVNDADSKMYTSYSSYNQRAPYYSSDCSAFVSFCWNISRTTTSAIAYRANYVSGQSIYNMQIGDILNKPDKHVVIVTDVGYTSSGKLSYIDISEQTPPIAKTTRYGGDGSKTLAELTAKYFNDGYTLYRNPNASSVSYTESSAVSVGTLDIGKNISKATLESSTSSGSSSSKTTSEQLGDRRDLVYRLYKYVLERTPKEAEIDGWMTNLKNGKFTGAELAAHFYFGAEGKTKIKDDSDFVKKLYRALYGRTAKNSEVKTWTNKDLLRWQYFRNFVNSQEFANECAECGIKQGTFDGTYLMDMYSDVKAFVTRLYNTALGRKTDAAGLKEWTCAIAGGDIGGSDAAYGFFFSQEFKDMGVDKYDYVTKLYKTFFNRKPDNAGYNAWINAMNNGKSRLEVMHGFSKSREFANLCAEYGITA